ncbi:MAG: caspase family protein [Burkholderiaceae bacterium]|nr:caspase family protein [Burkholderiaceae bacterium]
MSTPVFKRLSLQQFSDLLGRFPFTRRINAVHMHHTWRPQRTDFRGHETIVAMWRFHTQEKGWRDIAQHLTIDPEGWVWLGRNWNLPPVSASGHNGNAQFGPFMFEMIGNFDRGCDPFDGAQRETALEVVAQVQAKFGLPADSLVFHNAMSTKSCPGTSLDFAQILAEVEHLSATRGRAPKRAQESRGPFPDESDLVVRDAIEALSRSPLAPAEPGDAELSDDEGATAHGYRLPGEPPAPTGQGREPAERSRGTPIDAALLASLRPHLVNLRLGRLSQRGELSTTPADVDAIFEQSLPRALQAATAQGRRLRLLFYAHGGLVSESSGLQIAARHVEWWKRNDVYPIHFVWETGLLETIWQLLTRAQQGTMRGIPRDFWDHTLDPLIEVGARALQGARIWAGMKASAEHAVDAPSGGDPVGGGAHYVAAKLKAFCDAHPGEVELHAAGHSAGTIFHAHFLACAHELGVPTFASAQFLAPAVRIDTFRDRLAARIGDDGAVRRVTMFTMQRDYERADDCAQVYHKSMLYLVSNALESERGTPILGLEESLRADPQMKRLFGLGEAPSALADVVWSVSAADTGASASTARAHAAFDDDAPTMNSLARRVLGRADADAIVDYASVVRTAREPRPWSEEIDWPASALYEWPSMATSTWSAPAESALPSQVTPPTSPLAHAPGAVQPAVASPEPPTTPIVAIAPGGAMPTPTSLGIPAVAGRKERRTALCIGVDRYPDPKHRLAGCVADARMWFEALSTLGFETTMLTDGDATREAIDREFEKLVTNSRAGDVLVFQYSGHGTHLPDLDADEDDREDEAICPVDFASGALYIDDDIAGVLRKLPDGVNLTFFMDCCHSGTNTRFAVGAPDTRRRAAAADERKRFVVPSVELIDAHRRFRQQSRFAMLSASPGGTGGRSRMRDVKFAACLDSEVAWESDGHGEFTLRATRVLAEGIGATTNEQFARRVTEAFGASPRQHPMLDCTDEALALHLLQPLRSGASAAQPIGAIEKMLPPAAAPEQRPKPNGSSDDALLLQSTLAALQTLVTQLSTR